MMPKAFSPIFPPRRASGVVRYLLAAAIICILIFLFHHQSEPVRPTTTPVYSAPDTIQKPQPHPDSYVDVDVHHEKPAPRPGTGRVQGDKTSSGSSSSSESDGHQGAHPIDKLIYDAQMNFAELIYKESKTIEDAAQAYRKRRGRHPPPGFDKWYKFATDHNAVIVEDFFDQIYHDLEPFWGMQPAAMRKESWDFEMTIHIRDGVANSTSDWFWTVIWLDLIKTVDHLLPDMDLALNAMDEPRLVVPWEDVQKYMKKASKTVNLPRASKVRNQFQKLPLKPANGDELIQTREKDWESTSIMILGFNRRKY